MHVHIKRVELIVVVLQQWKKLPLKQSITRVIAKIAKIGTSNNIEIIVDQSIKKMMTIDKELIRNDKNTYSNDT